MENDFTSHQERQERAIRTRDGSFTFYSARFNQHYHSQFGAEAESNYVFLKACRVEEKFEHQDSQNIFEMGFGTGLNFLLTCELALQSKKSLSFYSVEKYPLTLSHMLEFDYSSRFDRETIATFLLGYERLKEGWNEIRISESIRLHLFIGDFLDLSFPPAIEFDAFFHDAFSRDVNADLWTDTVFLKLLRVAHHNAMLSTYASATLARAAMAYAGWFPCRFLGGVGKREMTVAFASDKSVDLPMLKTDKLKQKWSENSIRG